MTLSTSSDACAVFLSCPEGTEWVAAEPDELIARYGTTPQLSENSRQGFERKNLSSYQGSAWTNSASALGIREVLLGTRVKSRCTGKERDAESGLDDFGARYYSSSLGRFVSADWSAIPEPVPYADFGDPQSLNLYTYVRNVPTVKVDADGHCGDFDQQCNVGIFKGLLNVVTSTINGIATMVGQASRGEVIGGPPRVGEDGNPIADRNALPAIPQLQPSNSTQAAAMQAVNDVATAAAIVGVVDGVTDLAGSAGPASKVDGIMNTVKEGGYDVKVNPKTATQEGNVTITHPTEPGTKLNVRVETHPLEPGGKPVRHANAELVKPGPKNRPVVKSNKHIDQ